MSTLNVECWAILSNMLDLWNELIAPQSMQIEGPKNVPPIIIFAEDEFAASSTRQSKRFRIDSKEYEQSAIVGASGATTEPNHWNYSNEHWKVGFF